MTLAEARAQVAEAFDGRPSGVFIDSANYGIPPTATVRALERALEGWQAGAADWLEWDTAGEACRAHFARLCHASPETVALMPAVSVGTGLVAASLPEGSTVLTATDDFTSVLFPFLAAAERRSVRVREAPLSRLADAVDGSTTLVAASWVHSATGAMVDVGELVTACRAHGARLLLDVTQGLGVVPFDVGDVDYVVCAAYKFLLCPRGVAFLRVAPDAAASVAPLVSGWRSADDPYGRFYGGPLTLAPTAARHDVSLAWHAWYGAERSLGMLAGLPEDVRQALACEPARRLAAALEQPPPTASIVSLAVRDSPELRRDLARHDIRLSMRGGRARASFHVYNRDADADIAASVLRPHLDPRGGAS